VSFIFISGEMHFKTCSNTGNYWYPANNQPNVEYGFSQFAVSSNGQVVTAISKYSGLWNSYDYGNNFIIKFTGSTETNIYFSGVAMSGSGMFQFVSVYGNGLWFSSDTGETWTNRVIYDVNNEPLFAEATGWSSIATSEDGSRVWATVSTALFGQEPTVISSVDGGFQWSVVYSGQNFFFLFSLCDTITPSYPSPPSSLFFQMQ
jgi:hypothetical protein